MSIFRLEPDLKNVEIKMKDEFDVVIMNDRMSRAKKEILTIVKNFIKK